MLRRGNHFSKHLQAAFTKYGEDQFAFDVIEQCLNEKVLLAAREQHWVDLHRKNGIEVFNKRLLVDVNTFVKVQITEERKEFLRNQSRHARKFRPKACNTKLREDDVRAIIRAYVDGETPGDLANQYSFFKSTIYDILARRTWDFVALDPEIESRLKAKVGAMPRKLGPEQRASIVEMLQQGKTSHEVSAKFGIHPVTATRILAEEVGPRTRNKGRSLFDHEVREIRKRIASGEKYAGIARDYNVSIMTISNIKTGRTCSHVKDDPNQSSSTSPPAVSPGSSSSVAVPEWNRASCSEGIQ